GRAAGEAAHARSVAVLAGPDGVDGLRWLRAFMEDERRRRDPFKREVVGSTVEPFAVDQRQAESMYARRSSVGTRVRGGAEMAVTADHPREIATPVVLILGRWPGEATDPDQRVVRREERPTGPSMLGN